MRFCSPICAKTIGPGFVAGTILSHLLFSISLSFTIRIFPHKSEASARSYPLHVDASLLTIRAHPQYIAILQGKESHHE